MIINNIDYKPDEYVIFANHDDAEAWLSGDESVGDKNIVEETAKPGQTYYAIYFRYNTMIEKAVEGSHGE